MIDVLAGYLGGKDIWNLAGLTGGMYLKSQASMPEDYGRPHEACSALSESFLPSVADLFALTIPFWRKR